MIVASCPQFSIVTLERSAYRATTVRFAAYMILSLLVKKCIRASTSLDAEAGRGGGLGSLCSLSISRSWAFNSRIRVRIRVYRYCTKSFGWIDQGYCKTLCCFSWSYSPDLFEIDQLDLIIMVSKAVYYIIVGSMEILHLSLYEVYTLVMLLHRVGQGEHYIR